MARYIQVPLEVDADRVAERIYDEMRERIPGWEPSDGQLDVWLIQSVARIMSDLNYIARDVPDTIFRYFGENMLGVAFKNPSYAYFAATVTAQDTDGYTIPAGLTVGVRTPSGEYAGFQTVAETQIPNGVDHVDDVQFVAVEPGAEASDLPTTADDVTIVDPLAWLVSVVGSTNTLGGEDGETEEEYLDRLVDEIRLMSPRPIVPIDYAILAKRIAGVDRAYTVNLWNADTNTANVEKCVTVVVADENGDPVSAQTKADVDALLQSMREINMLVFVRDPQYQAVDVTFSVRALPGYASGDVQARVQEALETYISPLEWGRIEDPEESHATILWRAANIVRYLEVAQIVNNVPGVDYIISLALNAGTSDVTLSPGSGVPVVLPTPGTITGSALASEV